MSLRPEERELCTLLVATGSGLAPFRALIQEQRRAARRAPLGLLFGCRTTADVLWGDELESWARERSEVRVDVTLSRPDPMWRGRTGYVQRHLEELIRRLEPELLFPLRALAEGGRVGHLARNLGRARRCDPNGGLRPMKRDARLGGLSSEHHQALVLSRSLIERRSAWTLDDGAALRRRFDAELEPHFCVEDEVLLPALRRAGATVLADRTADDHTFLRASVEAARAGDGQAARALGERLRDHVRFEERELFPACEETLPDDVLDEVARRAPKER